MDNKEKKEELFKELQALEGYESKEKETSIPHLKKEEPIKEKKEKKKGGLIFSIVFGVMVLVGIIAFYNNYSSFSFGSSQGFVRTSENEEKASQWIKDDTCFNTFNHASNTLKITCGKSNALRTFDNMTMGIIMTFDTEESNDEEYPFKLVEPAYDLMISVANTYQIFDKVVIQLDHGKIELKNRRIQTEILVDAKTTTFDAEITPEQMKRIARSQRFSLTMYDNKGKEMHSSDNEELFSYLKKQIEIGEVLYSLEGTEWNFD